MVVNASDIQICVYCPDGIGDGQYKPIAHIYNASLDIRASTKRVIHADNEDAIWEKDIIDSMSYSLAGSSYMVLAPGISFAFLKAKMYSREDVPLFFKIDTEEYFGTVKIINLRVSGNTEQNAQVTFTLKGQGKFSETEK